MDSELTDLSAEVFTTSVQLSWEAIISNDDITYTYEVAFIVSTDTECSSSNVNTLPDGYTSYLNTSDTEIEIIELEADTCYIFGVRIYSSYSTVPGDWNILVERTEGNCLYIYICIIIVKLFRNSLHSDYIVFSAISIACSLIDC